MDSQRRGRGSSSPNVSSGRSGITYPLGFKAAGVSCGIKAEGKDLCLIFSESVSTAAGAFTTNKFPAAPVILSSRRLREGKAQAIVANSGCANACTGEDGLLDAERMASIAGSALGIDPSLVLVASTGIIGKRLPMDKVEAGIKEAASRLSPEGGRDAAEAIMTTDRFPKEMSTEFSFEGKEVRIGGMAKGAGMISPRMATMLCFITTDAEIHPAVLRATLMKAVDSSFNRIVVDGDTSTNDTVIILANGMSGCRIVPGTESYRLFSSALNTVCEHLARKIVENGEGVTKLLDVRVKGARTPSDADKVGRAIVSSTLVKAAIHGSDPNWGRIMCAIGYSGADVGSDPDILIGGRIWIRDGHIEEMGEEDARALLSSDYIVLTVDLKEGIYESRFLGCDISEEYVSENSSYRS